MQSGDLDYWKSVWEKHRIRISQLGGILLFLIAKPRNNALFMLGFLIALAGEAVRFWAAGHIRKGRELAQHGPYAMMRNPLYFGSFIMTCGFAIICTTVRYWLSTSMIWGSVLATFYWLYPRKIDIEEDDLQKVFGAEFESYRQRVPRFWPDWSLRREAVATTHWDLEQVHKNKEHKTLLAVLGLVLLLRFKMVYH